MAGVWTQPEWRAFEAQTRSSIVSARTEQRQWNQAVRGAKHILRKYSTSFFIVTRFLPCAKREEVEIIYAAVRYPDEIVDTFPISAAERLCLLDACRQSYEKSLLAPSLRDCVEENLNTFISAFGQIVRKHGIPHNYYRAFLRAMESDVCPRMYTDLDDLIDSYIFGSATVVGFFLAYVYGPSAPGNFERALGASKKLAIALQLTNFLRDIPADLGRGRVYLPLAMLRAEGLEDIRTHDEASRLALRRVVRRLSEKAEVFYAGAERELQSFSPDCRTAIQCCINVYRRLNLRIALNSDGIEHRETVPIREKLSELPPSKYWRLPLAYLGAI